MAQTAAVVRQVLTATGGGTTDFTKSGFGTPTAAILIACKAIPAANPAASARFSIGFWDGTNQRMVGMVDNDNVATTAAGTVSDDSYGMGFPGTNAAAAPASFTVSAITDGIRLTMTVDNTSDTYFCTVLLLAGISAKLVTFTMNATQDAATATASLGFAPKCAFFTTIGRATADFCTLANSPTISFGFAEINGTHRSLTQRVAHAAAAEALDELYSETRCVANIAGGVVTTAGEVTTWGADTLTVTTRDGASSSHIVFILALGGDVSYDVGTLTTRTATGNDINATDIAPAALLLALGTVTGTTVKADSEANGFMVGLADVDGQFSHNISMEDAADPTNCNSAAQALACLDLDSSASGARTNLCDATVTLNAADFTLNYTVVNASARKGWWVAFGIPPVPVQPLIIQYSAAVRRASTY